MKRQHISPAAAAEMEHIISKMGLFFSEIERAFTRHKITLKFEQTVTQIDREIREAFVLLHTSVAKLPDKEALAVQTAILNLSGVNHNILRLSNETEIKIDNNILFSKEAATEVTTIMKRTLELFPHVTDSLRVSNDLIISHILSEADIITELAIQAAAKHEDRLCEGKCHPKAASVYIKMLELIKDMLWHFKALLSESGIPEIK